MLDLDRTGAGGNGALELLDLAVVRDVVESESATFGTAAVWRTGFQLARAVASLLRILRRADGSWPIAIDASPVAASNVKQRVQDDNRTGFTNGFLVSMRESCDARA